MAVVSEVAQIKANIASEYMAAQWGLFGFASGGSRHAFITARMEKMGEGQKRLANILGEEKAIEDIASLLVTLPEKPERRAIIDVILCIRGETEDTRILIEHIEEMWETVDLIKKEFGEEEAQKIIVAPAPFVSDVAVSND